MSKAAGVLRGFWRLPAGVRAVCIDIDVVVLILFMGEHSVKTNWYR